MEIKKCPKCGASAFYVTVHVTQDWEVDGRGSFINTIDDCVEITHRPDDNDMWECVVCGHSAPGRDFNVQEE